MSQRDVHCHFIAVFALIIALAPIVYHLTPKNECMSRKRMLFITVWVGIAASLSFAEFQRNEPHLGSRILGVLLVSAVVMFGLYLGSEWLTKRKLGQGRIKNIWMPVLFVVLFGGLSLLLVCASFLTVSQPTTTQSNVAKQTPQNTPPLNGTIQTTPKHLALNQAMNIYEN